MKENRFVEGRFMRCGYTTGSCAAAAAKAACEMLLSQADVQEATIELPGGDELTLLVELASFSSKSAACAVKKDSGDDLDVTDGALICAAVKLTTSKITIGGGVGVGRVTKPGLDQPVGKPAINSVPRTMIENEIAKVCAKYGYKGGISVVISVPDGEEMAARTFNSRLGIEGGISILGTRGIVEPMSNEALASAIRTELKVRAALGERNLLLAVGNYAENFMRGVLRLPTENCLKCGNYIGESLGAATESGFENLLIAGHIGKLVKLGIGITNTHSAFGDGRNEALIACALRAGAPVDVLHEIDECVTTKAAIGVLKEFGYLSKTMEILGKRVDNTLKQLVSPETQIGFICFLDDEILMESSNIKTMIDIWRDGD